MSKGKPWQRQPKSGKYAQPKKGKPAPRPKTEDDIDWLHFFRDEDE